MTEERVTEERVTEGRVTEGRDLREGRKYSKGQEGRTEGTYRRTRQTGRTEGRKEGIRKAETNRKARRDGWKREMDERGNGRTDGREVSTESPKKRNILR